MNFNNMDYALLTKNISKIIKQNPFVSVFSVGKSVKGRDILCIKMGKGNRKIFLNGAHHGLEWITSSLLLSYVNEFSEKLKNEDTMCGYSVLDIYKNASFYIIPMVNPDGVEIALHGIKKEDESYTLVKKALCGKKCEKVWQANANGVDLNHNYDASFYEGVKAANKLGINSPSPTRFSGLYPFSEPETRAVKELCEKQNFDICIAFHSQGEVIYWDYQNLGFLDDAKRLCDVSGYELYNAEGMESFSGFKDWVLEKFKTPAFTIEVGTGVNPVKFSQFEKIRNDGFKIINECCCF